MLGPPCVSVLTIIPTLLLDISMAQSYNFVYNVADVVSGNYQGRSESSDGDVVRGKYEVLLPDGRLQIVTYIADENGYRPTIQYTDGSAVSSGVLPELDRTAGSKKPPQCTVLPNPGECRGAFPRYFFNSTSSQCDCFLYGGCDDEEPTSSWLTLDECSATCSPDKTDPGPRCKSMTQIDIQTFKQPDILQNLDTSDLSDSELLDLFR